MGNASSIPQVVGIALVFCPVIVLTLTSVVSQALKSS